MMGKRNAWNPIYNAVVATVNKRSIGSEIARYTLATRLLHDHLDEDDAHMWEAKSRALLDD